MASSSYTFPTDKLLRRHALYKDKEPVVLVACGSFSPITFLHLRMFEMARDHLHMHSEFRVVGGYLSPVNDAYKKKGLAKAEHRINMCRLAVQASDWIMVDPYEAVQKDYTPTALVLDHFNKELNENNGGVEVEVEDDWGAVQVVKKKCRIMLLAGSDLIQTMSVPGVWSEEDLHHILGLFGCVIISRADSELDTSIFNSTDVHSRSPLALYRSNVRIVDQLVRNDVSSTKVRLFLKKGLSVLYLIPTEVAAYIQHNGLYVGTEYNSSTSNMARKNSSDGREPSAEPPSIST